MGLVGEPLVDGPSQPKLSAQFIGLFAVDSLITLEISISHRLSFCHTKNIQKHLWTMLSRLMVL